MYMALNGQSQQLLPMGNLSATTISLYKLALNSIFCYWREELCNRTLWGAWGLTVMWVKEKVKGGFLWYIRSWVPCKIWKLFFICFSKGENCPFPPSVLKTIEFKIVLFPGDLLKTQKKKKKAWSNCRILAPFKFWPRHPLDFLFWLQPQEIWAGLTVHHPCLGQHGDLNLLFGHRLLQLFNYPTFCSNIRHFCIGTSSKIQNWRTTKAAHLPPKKKSIVTVNGKKKSVLSCKELAIFHWFSRTHFPELIVFIEMLSLKMLSLRTSRTRN